MKLRIFALSTFLFSYPSLMLADEIWLGITTTLRDSGLLNVIAASFEAETDHEVILLAQSSGHILQTARDGNLDLVITHDVELEMEFHAQGYSIEQRPLAQSQYVLVGPAEDPAEIRRRPVDQAFAMIFESGNLFVTRNDLSGTSQRENQIWQNLAIEVGDFRISTGQGMGETLNIASAMNGYVFSEMASFLAFENKGSLEILTQEGRDLENTYTLSVMNEKFQKTPSSEAVKEFITFLKSEKTRKFIENYEILGVQPFHLPKTN